MYANLAEVATPVHLAQRGVMLCTVLLVGADGSIQTLENQIWLFQVSSFQKQENLAHVIIQ